jgi:hypothetical protein
MAASAERIEFDGRVATWTPASAGVRTASHPIVTRATIAMIFNTMNVLCTFEPTRTPRQLTIVSTAIAPTAIAVGGIADVVSSRT